MSLEGLKVIMDKREVLSTAHVQQMLDNPRMVEEQYLHHVRAYLPMGRAVGSNDQQQSVADYEKSLINKVKGGTGLSGYISAEYGYGKTSTAAFLWQRCSEARILCVPPFQIEQLSDILTAAYAWGRYELGRTRPQFRDELEQLYNTYAQHGVERDAEGSAEATRILHKLSLEGSYTARLNPGQMLGFLDAYTDLALRAGYEGVVILPDELQQYMNPAINSGAADPLSDMFSLINGLGTRRGHLRAAIVFIIPTKEHGLIRLQRGDIIDRMQENGLTFDLNSIYDADFATRLWQKLAREFDFERESGSIVEANTLRALGQIAERNDLGSGPRTVIDGYKTIVNQYTATLDSHGQAKPYTPIDLIDGYLSGAMRFTGEGKLTNVVRDALRHPQVVGQLRRGQAVKLIAAFPSTGLSLAEVRAYGYADEVADLHEQQLTIHPGGRDSDGRVTDGYTLRGLEPENRESGWLTTTLSEFRRLNFQERSSKATEMAANGFKELLLKRVFKDWKVLADTRANEVHDAALLLEGSFPTTNQRPRKYPARRVFVHIIGEGQPRRTSQPMDADLILEFDLNRYSELSEEQRRTFPGEIGELDKVSRTLRIKLNLARHSSNKMFAALQEDLNPILIPERATPLALLNIYTYLDEIARYKQIPQTESVVQFQFMPDLLDGAITELFSTALGQNRAGGKVIIEDTFREAMAVIYPNYETISSAANYGKVLREYITALERLDTPFQRRGEEPYVGTKDEVADLFNRQNTGIDSVVSGFPLLLRVDGREWTAKKKANVLFTLHPWEQQVISELNTRGVADLVSGKKRIKLREVRAAGRVAGYREEEIEALLDLLAARNLAERQGAEYLVQAESKLLSPTELRQQLSDYLARVGKLLLAFSDDAILNQQKAALVQRLSEVEVNQKLDERAISKLSQDLKGRIGVLESWRRSKHNDLHKNLRHAEPPAGLKDSELRMALQTYSGPLAEQLEPVRERVAAEVARLAAALGQMGSQHQQLREMLPRLEPGVEPIREEQLIAANVIFEELHKGKEEGSNQVDKVRWMLRQWEAITTLMAEAEGLRQEISSDGEFATALSNEYEAWASSVRSRLSISRIDALGETSDWLDGLNRLRSHLSDLKRRREQDKQTAARNFSRLQEEYREGLRGVGIPADRLFPELTYNPANPVASNIQLTEVVIANWYSPISQLVKVSCGLDEEANQMQNALARDEANPNRATLLTTSAQVRAQLSQIVQQASALQHETAEHVAVGPQAAKERLVPPFIVTRDQLVKVSIQMNELRASFSALKLSDSEQMMLDKMTGMPAPDGYVDLSSLMSADGASEEELWRDLNALYRKLRLRVKLQVIKHE